MKLNIALAHKRNVRKWVNKKTTWDFLAGKLATTQRTSETFKEYLRAPKSLQADIKDVGGFVGGYLNQGKRSPSTVRHRQIVTLDIDDCPVSMDEGLVDTIIANIPYELVIYSTHKHTPEKPRLRVVFPLDRPASPEEYEAVARYLAGEVNIEHFDPTTFQPERFMYWPSTASDGEYFYHREMFKEFCPVDEILANYIDWKDVTAWPRLSTEEPKLEQESRRAGEPEEKEGIVGAFCRAYDVVDAIDMFLPKVYGEAGTRRYTYLDGTTAGGAVVYGKNSFLYSHHSTDPIRGMLANAFDLVRIHKFGGLDGDTDKPMSKRESFSAMCDFALKDKNVKAELDSVDRPLSKAIYTDFADDAEEAEGLGEPLDDPDDIFGDLTVVNVGNVPDFYKPVFKDELPGGINAENWKDKLERTKKGDIEPKISNLKLILIFDPDLKGKISLNEFDRAVYVTGSLPWDSSNTFRKWEDKDAAGLRELVETKYDVYHISKIIDALMLTASFNKFHPVQTFLENCEWDGVPRLDTLLIDYMGADDTPYVRAVTRKAFTAAVARVFNPGCKFDYVLTLTGPEGIRKSSLIAEMAGRWFSDTFVLTDNSKAFEQLQGSWLIEIAELSAFNKAEVNSIKAFVTKRHDKYRPAYGHNTVDAARQCVFIATTNEHEFLRGHTGNRRFWPVEVRTKFSGAPVAAKAGNGAETILGLPVQLLWGEAKHYFEKGEKLYLSDELEVEAKKQQDEFSEEHSWTSQIEEYLDTPIPTNWENIYRLERIDYLRDPKNSLHSDGDLMYRQFVCAKEVWEECLGFQLKDLNNYKLKELNALLNRLPGWQRGGDTKRAFPPYGRCRYFERVNVKEYV